MFGLRIKGLWTSEFLFSIDFIKLLNTLKSYSLVYGIIMIGLSFDSAELQGAFEKKEVGASSFALGNAAVAIDRHMFAIYYNPAALSTKENFRTVFSFQNYFGIGGLNAVDLTTNFCLADHPISFAINRFGNQIYQEIQLTAASRYEIIQNCAIGFSVQCYILSIRYYGQALTWGLNLSALYNVLPNISIGAMVTNLNQPVISSVHEHLPQTMSLGFCYIPVTGLLIAFEIFEDVRFNHEIRAGFSYRVMPLLTVRVGIEDQLSLYSYGVGINMEMINFDYTLRNHPALGLSHIITISVLL